MAKAKSKKITIDDALVTAEEQPYEVPENWCWTKVRYVSEVVTGSTPSKKHEEYYGGAFPFFKPADLDAGDNVVDATEYLSDEGKAVSRIVPRLSTAVCCIGTIGKSGLLKIEGTTNQQINSMIPRINPLYVYYYSKTNEFVRELWDKSTSTTISMVNKSNMETNNIPLPPLPEQQRIVEQIESLFSKLDEAKEKAEGSLEMLKEQYEGIIQQACDGELSLSWRAGKGISIESWEKGVIGDYITKLTQGWSPKCNSNPSVSPDTWGVIKTTAIQRMYYDDSENKELPTTMEPRTKHEIKPGDILVTRAGPRIRVGICCLVKETREKLLLCDKAYRFQTKAEKMIPDYFVLLMNSSKMMDTINKMKTGISDSGLNLTQDGFTNIEVFCPSIDEQSFIIDICFPMLENNLNTQRIVEEMLERIDNLKKSILAKAFRGELGTNDSSEESSIELLKQIIEE